MDDHYEQRVHLTEAAKPRTQPPFIPASIMLAIMEIERDGGPVDEQTGLALLRQAADQHDRDAMYLVGLMYASGAHGVPAMERRVELLQAAALVGQEHAKIYCRTQLGMEREE